MELLSKASDVRLARSKEQSHLLLIDLPDDVVHTCGRAFPQARIDVIAGFRNVSAELWSAVPDLVLIDAFRDPSEGLGTLAALSTSRSAPFIVVSEAADPVDRAVAIELGATDYIAVPFFEREFVARVKRALASF